MKPRAWKSLTTIGLCGLVYDCESQQSINKSMKQFVSSISMKFLDLFSSSSSQSSEIGACGFDSH